MSIVIGRVKQLFSLLLTQVEERPVRAICVLWFISLPVAALISLLAALQWRDDHIASSMNEEEYLLTQRVQRVAEMAELKFDLIRKLTALLATDSRIIDVLKGGGNFAECTIYLQTVSNILRLHRIFVLDKNGVCVASNDADLPHNLLGVNLSDREYFIQAMAGKGAVQYVVGRVSTVSGFHFSAPVKGLGGYLGVAVLKLDPGTLAHQLYLPSGFVTDNAGVVVLSDPPENRLRVVPGGSAASLDPAQCMLRYQRERLEPVYMQKASVYGHEAWLLRPGGQPNLLKSVKIDNEGRSVYGFTDLSPLLKDVEAGFRMRLAATFFFFILGLAVLISTFVHLLRDRYLRRKLQNLNDTLRIQAQHDSLTGLLNRRMFDEMAGAWFAQTLRIGVPFSLVLFDIDHFKRLNDALGHQAGDHVLRELARCVQGCLSRQGDWVFRIGGEEFAVLASATNSKQILSLMEVLRKAVKNMGLQHPDGVEKVVTISLGGLLVQRGCSMTLDAAFRKADEALYRAKAEGRNRSVLTECCSQKALPNGD